MKRFSIKIIISLVIIFFFGFLSVHNVNALTISNPRIEVSADPGERVEQTVNLYNETKEKLVLSSSTQSFKAGNESGKPQIISSEKSRDLASWVEISKEPIALNPGEIKKISFAINVPANAEPGGYYAIILWSVAGAANVPVSIVGATGHLVLLKVNGEANEAAKLLSFNAKTGENFFTSLPIDFSARVENTGNVHLKPFGGVTIKNLFGKEINLAEMNSEEGNILPKSIRSFDGSFEKKFAMGRYTAELVLTYSAGEAPLRATIHFWIFPWPLVLILAIVIIILNISVRKYYRFVMKKKGAIK